MKLRHVQLIAGYSARHSVRGGIGLVFLLLSLTFGLIVAHTMLQPVELAAAQFAKHGREADRAQATERALAAITDQAHPVVSWMLTPGGSAEPDADAKAAAERWASYLLDDQPALLSAIFLILLFGWPFVLAFGAFDLFAGDIGSRQLRYQLLRADRSSIYFGRLLGLVLTFVLVLLLLGATVTLYIGLKLSLYPWSALLLWAAYGTAALIVVSLPYVALCAWLSTAVGSSFGSLTFASLAIGGVPLLAMFGRAQHEAVGYVNYVLPWGFQTRLFHDDPLQVTLAVAGCALQTAVYTWLGHRTFTRRDL
ncbi:MAG: hypothetical protein JNL08_01840 [Planctomycetes bacterium]|nr:hypothetical protein [Planctomycetota bacterium]